MQLSTTVLSMLKQPWKILECIHVQPASPQLQTLKSGQMFSVSTAYPAPRLKVASHFGHFRRQNRTLWKACRMSSQLGDTRRILDSQVEPCHVRLLPGTVFLPRQQFVLPHGQVRGAVLFPRQLSLQPRSQCRRAADMVGERGQPLRSSSVTSCRPVLCSAYRGPEGGGGGGEDPEPSRQKDVNIAVQSGMLGVAVTVLLSGSLTKDGGFLGYIIALLFLVGILYQVFMLLYALDVGIGRKLMGNCPWCGVPFGVLEITIGLEEVGHECPSCLQKFEVVDQIFVRQGPNFGDAETKSRSDPFVGHGNQSRPTAKEQPHSETKSKKGFGASKGEKERSHSQKSQTRPSSAPRTNEDWKDVVDIEAKVRDKN